MVTWKKTYSIRKSLVKNIENIQTKTFSLKSYTNGVPWHNPTLISAGTSIYTKDGNRFYSNSISRTGDSITVSNKTTGNTININTYNSGGWNTPAEKPLWDGSDSRDPTITNWTYNNIQSVKFKLELFRVGFNPQPTMSFDVFINDVKQTSFGYNNGIVYGAFPLGSDMMPTADQRIYLGAIMLYIDFLLPAVGDIKIEIRNGSINGSNGGVFGATVYIKEEVIETSIPSTTTYNDVLVYAIDE